MLCNEDIRKVIEIFIYRLNRAIKKRDQTEEKLQDDDKEKIIKFPDRNVNDRDNSE